MAEEENTTVESEEKPKLRQRRTTQTNKRRDRQESSQPIVGTYANEQFTFLVNANKSWVRFTDPPYLNWVGIEHYKDGQKIISYERASELRQSIDHENDDNIFKGRPYNKYRMWSEWKEHRYAKYPDFLPGITTSLLPEKYNIWQPCNFEPKPCEPKLLKPFLDHIRYVWCKGSTKSYDKELYDFTIKWLANTIKYPQDRPGIALILLGAQGCGKGVIGAYMEKLHSPHYLEATRLDDVIGDFNAQIENRTFVYIDNISAINAREVEILKTYITQRNLSINEKRQPKRTVNNFANFMFASNNRDRKIFRLEADDRRFFILDLDDHYASINDSPERDNYFDVLWSGVNNPEIISGLLYYFQNEVEVSRDDFRKIPETIARTRTILQSYDSVTQWYLEWLLDGVLDPSWVSKESPELYTGDWSEIKSSIYVYKHLLRDHYRDYWNDNKLRFMELGETSPADDKTFTQKMRDYNPLIKPSGINWGRRDSKSPRLWTYPTPSLESCRNFLADQLDKNLEVLFQI